MKIIDKEYKVDPDALLISETDANGKITYVNSAFCEVSGYTHEELLHNPHTIVRHPSMPKILFERMWDNLKLLKAWHGSIKNLRKDGSYFWMELEIQPVTNEDGVLEHYIAVYRSLSEKNRDEAEKIYEKERVNENFNQ